MTSWRDSASLQAQADLDQLLERVLPFAERVLSERGELYPFGMVLAADGDVRMAVADVGELPEHLDAYTRLVAGVRRDRDDLHAVALACDERTAEAGSIRVELEHRDGVVVALRVPYRRKFLRKNMAYGEPVEDTVPASVWR